MSRGSTLPRLDFLHAPAGALTLLIVCHGGGEESNRPAGDWQPGLLRVLPFVDRARSIAPDVAIGLLRYRVNGWNEDREDVAKDLLTMLDAYETPYERLLLLGHSLGGRVVVRGADHARVEGTLAISPWVPDDEPPLSGGRCVVLVTGARDSDCPPTETRDFARRSRAAGAELSCLEIRDAGHSWLLGGVKELDGVIEAFLTHALGMRHDWLDKTFSVDPGHGADVVPPVGASIGLFRGAVSLAKSLITVKKVNDP